MLPPKHCNINLTGPIPRWDEAIPLGNGILGSLFWGAMEHLRISVDIAGLWLRRRPEEKLDKEFTYAKLVELARKGDVAETRRIFDTPYARPTPTKIPAGHLFLDGLPRGSYQASLDLGTAVAFFSQKGTTILRAFLCMGRPVGVLMLPVLYHLLKQLFRRTRLAFAGTVLFAFDFMHFTQTRIATIDTYAVFFLLLMYDAMVVFLKGDVGRDSWKRLLPPLLVCGVFTGLGIAAKWTAAYGALGLAGLFFGKLAFTLWEARRRGEDVRPLVRKCLQLCAWCCLFFIAIPFGIYFAAFLPITTLSHNGGKLWWAFWNYQTTMFNYHAHLEATHSFASPWYEWPFDIRPIWYFAQDNWNGYSTISSFGNPLLWWGCLPALAAAAYLWWKERPRWAAVVLAGFGSVYLPWVLVPRLTFIYHYFTAVPFLVVALCGVFSLLYEKGPFARRLTFPGGLECQGATLLLAAFAAGCLLLFAVYFPVLSGAPTTREYADALELFDSWYFA